MIVCPDNIHTTICSMNISYHTDIICSLKCSYLDKTINFPFHTADYIKNSTSVNYNQPGEHFLDSTNMISPCPIQKKYMVSSEIGCSYMLLWATKRTDNNLFIPLVSQGYKWPVNSRKGGIGIFIWKSITSWKSIMFYVEKYQLSVDYN